MPYTFISPNDPIVENCKQVLPLSLLPLSLKTRSIVGFLQTTVLLSARLPLFKLARAQPGG